MRAIGLVCAGSALAVCALTLHLAAAPIFTADFWWHLSLGGLYAGEGLWPAADPFVHTARGAPDPHEWLFDVALFGLQRALGFHGLRVVHGLAALGILALAWSLFRRESGSAAAAWLALLVWTVMAWYRLVQLRPDLVSIGATLLMFRLLLQSQAPPSWSRVGGAALVFLVWVNAHSLFAVGLVLLATALAGVMLRGLAARALARETGAEDAALAARLAAALGLCTLATLVNPKGLGAHLTFFRASSGLELWRIGDEWAPFQPFTWTHDPGGMSRLAWLTTDALLAALALAALVGGVQLLRRRDRDALRGVDPMLFGLGAASVAAILLGQRFLWLSVFPLLCLLRSFAPIPARHPALAGGALAAAALALAVAFPAYGGTRHFRVHLPESAAAYLSLPWLGTGHHVEGVRFLRETGLEGNLFNAYATGGFLGYWLAPRLRTFIDGRLNITNDVLLDYFSVVSMSEGTGESWLDVLDRRGVDVFFGVGAPVSVPPYRPRTFTAGHLERHPDWLLVSRSVHHAIWLRRDARNRENLERVTAWYARQGVPFDPERGLDPAAVIEARPDWAIAHGLLPVHYERVRAASRSPDRKERYRALSLLGFVYTLLGAYEAEIRVDREAASLRPDAKGPQRRLANSFIRLGRAQEAVATTNELLHIDPRDERSQFMAMVARELKRSAPEPGQPPPLALEAAISQLPVANQADVTALRRRFVRPGLTR